MAPRSIESGEIAALAQDATDADTFERELLTLLGRAIGFDMAFVDRKSGSIRTAVGLDAPRVPGSGERAVAYERELSEVRRVALLRRGVAIDTDVLGEARVNASSYHRELAAPYGGKHSLLAYAMVRKTDVGGLMLGRTGSQFRHREVELVERLLPTIALSIASFAREPERPRPVHSWTPREAEILHYLCLGHTNASIALALGSSPNTVRNQLVRIFEKLGASSRAEAVALVMRPPSE